MARQNLKTLSVSFRDERMGPVKKRLSRDADCFSGEIPLKLPTGEAVSVYAEVFEAGEESPDPDVSITIEGPDEAIWCSVRCSSGAIVSYVTPGGMEIIAQVGTGPWEA
jgi:hypothetical protein